MFIPITSEITLETGMILKEIATGRLFQIGKRLKNDSEIWGDDPWELTEVTTGEPERVAAAYLELSEKYLAEREEEPR